MERSSIKLMAAAMLLSVMLAGCGAKDEGQPANNGQAAVSNVGNSASGSGPVQPDRTSDFFAKVVSVSDNTIVVQKSTTKPSDMPQGGGFGGGGGGQRPKGDGKQTGDNGNAPSADFQAPADGDQPADGGAEPPAGAAQGGQNGQAGAGNGRGGNRQGGGRFGGGGFMNQMKYEDAQTSVAVDTDTKIVSISRGQDGMTTNTLQAADLKAGDVLSVWLASDNTTAQYIMLRFNPADMQGQGKAGNGQ
ncbi:hypothetical protein [Paenibacillus sp. OV219]|uniref:hypothetical protein n=1 Tax=Paenibacillus sp. OV219 TaxID=1884377 RepID=UPI0008D5A5BD|nr:hypothetical protein [Paenibacillus sp. OV219]SEP10524.1 hypothetical protein SAMN05518847_11711 [Paenibacillus sp. OV219]